MIDEREGPARRFEAYRAHVQAAPCRLRRSTTETDDAIQVAFIPFDVLNGTYYPDAMRIKRTYNLSPETVATVKRLAEVEHIAATQDAVVERAVAELSRQLRDVQDMQRWSEAPGDTALQQELRQIDAELPPADLTPWE